MLAVGREGFEEYVSIVCSALQLLSLKSEQTGIGKRVVFTSTVNYFFFFPPEHLNN